MAKQEVAHQATPLDVAINNKFINQLSQQLTEKQQYGLTFPKDYNVTNALNAAYLMLQDMTIKKNERGQWNEYKVMDICSKQSIASSLMDMTVQALNPIKKQCYFVPMGDKLTLMRSYQGTMSVAKRCGVTKTPVAQIIYDGDVFKYHIDNGRYVIDEHVQDFMNIDNTKIKGAYAILDTVDGPYVEIMNIEQIKKAWQKGKGYKEGSGVHSEFSDQMAKKTVLSRACKNFINSSDDGNLVESFNAASDNENLDQVEENVTHDIEVKANAVDFTEVVEQEEVEKCEGEVIEETPVKAETKGTDEPDWVN